MKWEIVVVITVNYYGSLSYSCYFSAVVIPDAVVTIKNISKTPKGGELYARR